MWRGAVLALASALLVTIALVERGGAQTDAASGHQSEAAQSTMSGVYTQAQATRGEETYMAVCVSCHPAGTYKTPVFKLAWNGRLLSELFDQVREKMPKNDPASLTPEEYAQVVAYLLRINAIPAGDAELPADSEALKKIRIEMPPAQDRHD